EIAETGGHVCAHFYRALDASFALDMIFDREFDPLRQACSLLGSNELDRYGFRDSHGKIDPEPRRSERLLLITSDRRNQARSYSAMCDLAFGSIFVADQAEHERLSSPS